MTADDARHRFDAATSRHLTAPLAEGIAIRAVGPEGWTALTASLWTGGGARPGVSLEPLMPPGYAERASDLAAVIGPLLAHRLVFERGDELVGAFFGQQDTYGRYEMTQSVIHPAWRGRGLYGALLPRVVAAARDAGFREVVSRHRADNNSILVPKLRAGFVISGFDISPRWGLLVHLRRYLVDDLAQMHAYRVDGAEREALVARGVKLP